MSNDLTIDALHRAVDQAAQRVAITATNLANADTPGYRARELLFHERHGPRQVEIARSDRGHIGVGPTAKAEVRDTTPLRVRPDGNTVDVDVEMTRLAALQGRYIAMTQMIRKQFALLRYAATDGRQ